MRIEDIKISLIDIPANRRVVDMNTAAGISADMAEKGQLTPIEVVEAGARFRLISGAHRIEARKILGTDTITACVRLMSEFRDEAEIKLREISENMMRRGLSVLDKSFDIADWRAIYEAVHGAVKAGRKKNRGKSAPISEDEIDDASDAFAASFGEAAQAAFGLNKDAIKRALRIASIAQAVRARISLHAIADNQSELLLLATQTAERQAQIAGLLLAAPPAATTVAGAIAIIDRVPMIAAPEAWERLSSKFAKLPDAAKRRFLTEHWSLVEELYSERLRGKAA